MALAATTPISVGAATDANSSHDGEIERWVFSSALEVGIFAHTAKGNVRGSDVIGPRTTTPSESQGDSRCTCLVDPKNSREEVSAALVGGDFEVMTPALFDVPSRPRLFMDFNISAVLTNDVGLARDAEPSPVLEYPFGLSGGAAGEALGETTIEGRGTKTIIQHQGPQLHAGIGTAFTFDFGPERIRIKPSFVYSRAVLDISVEAARAIRLQQGPGTSFDDNFRTFYGADDFREVYHGIGPALEIEYETRNRIGPFSVTLFLKGHAIHFLGDLKTRFTVSNPDYPGEQVDWKYTQNAWAYRASTGIRFRLVPKRKR